MIIEKIIEDLEKRKKFQERFTEKEIEYKFYFFTIVIVTKLSFLELCTYNVIIRISKE
jgi:hypothetical protein